MHQANNGYRNNSHMIYRCTANKYVVVDLLWSLCTGYHSKACLWQMYHPEWVEITLV